MINKIIIFGSNGMLGTYVSKYFSKKSNIEVISITRNEFEINTNNIYKLDDFLNNHKINEHSCIINCIGLIPQRNTNNNDYYIVNTLFPLYLSKICIKYGSKLICPTTDCVFSGKKGNYTETDFHDEINNYGISKSLGEPSDATVIRVSIIGEEINNKKSFLEFVKNSEGIINGWDNHYWNGITCYQYCKIIDKIIVDNLFWKGSRHLFSPQKKSKYELACIIKDVYKLPITINKLFTSETVDKTLNSSYYINDLFNIPSLEIQIEEQKDYLNYN